MAVSSIPNIPVAQQPQFTKLVPDNNSSGGLSFGDIMDTINPLQHIPIVSGMYRAATGGTISNTAKLAGDTLYGAIFGGAVISFAASLADIGVKQATGEDVSQHVVATIDSITSSSPNSMPASMLAKVTPLIPTSNVAAAATGTVTPPATVGASTNNSVPMPFAFTAAQHVRNNAQYQHAMTMDSLNKQLTQM